MGSNSIILLFLTVTLFLTFHKFELNIQNSLNSHKFNSNIPHQDISSIHYQDHYPIFIDGNSDFHVQAANEGWDLAGTRDGTYLKPYLIDGYQIINSTIDLIKIMNTDVYFQISNNFLQDMSWSHDGISLSNVTHGIIIYNTIYASWNAISLVSFTNHVTIANNTLHNNEAGIYLYSSANQNIISGNTIYYEYQGIYLSSSTHSNNITQNEIRDSGIGIELSSSSHNTISDNVIERNYNEGIRLSTANNNTLSSNIISYNSRGIILIQSDLNELVNNICSNNSEDGIEIFGNYPICSCNNSLINNICENNGLNGIWLDGGSNNTLENNFLKNNSIGIALVGGASGPNNDNRLLRNYCLKNINYGLMLDTSAENNRIELNEFIQNRNNNTQAYDSGFQNVFDYNYWSDWSSNPDSDDNGIFDIAYPIDGSAMNFDLHPLVEPGKVMYKIHDPISIDGDGDFATLGFPGNGTLGNPFIINGYSISNASTSLLSIRNTTVYFTIINNLLNGLTEANNGICLENVTHCTITNNIIRNTRNGTTFRNAKSNIVTHNTIYNSGGIGFWLTGSTNNTLLNNSITNNNFGGILLSGTVENPCSENYISDNIISNNNMHGIRLYGSSYENIVTGNTIVQNINYGLYIENAYNNTVMWNKYIENNYGTYQGFDNGIGNVFNYNYWSDWTIPDDDKNSIVDQPYPIDGLTGNIDPNPCVDPNIMAYIEHDPILIDSNDDFITLGFHGDGTPSNPFRIEHYNITDATINLIDIRNTNMYFHINNNLLNGKNGDHSSIYLYNVTHGIIENNKICESKNGIELFYSTNDIIITGNIIFNHQEEGIWLSADVEGITILNNTIKNNGWYGIRLGFAGSSVNYNQIINNVIRNNDQGIELEFLVNENTLLGNHVYDNSKYGISVNSANNTISNNLVYDNYEYAICLHSLSRDNIITKNDFVRNDGSSQACDDGTNNIFHRNYWRDWVRPDNNRDGIVDIPYGIEGSAGNTDPYPLASPNSPLENHTISKPTILYPNGGEILSTSVTIQWTASTDSWGHSIMYAIYYTDDGGNNWIGIASDLTTTSYYWDTTQVLNGGSYRIEVVASCSQGIVEEDQSDGIFTIHNLIETTSPSTFQSTTSSIFSESRNLPSTWTSSITTEFGEIPTISATPSWTFSIILSTILITLIFRKVQQRINEK
ncbi:MAG: right-handed parallel beta-helix repeat-containing protein [Candidatus Heimdallarchaeota archaeon]|nr:MAG: right-handed parallel beta-helix repeat-containing protein [Candidatus Heimdallarchaeota archaeon]